MTRELTPAELRALQIVIDTLRDIKTRTGHGRLLLAVEIAEGRETLFEYTPTFKEKPPR